MRRQALAAFPQSDRVLHRDPGLRNGHASS